MPIVVTVNCWRLNRLLDQYELHFLKKNNILIIEHDGESIVVDLAENLILILINL